MDGFALFWISSSFNDSELKTTSTFPNKRYLCDNKIPIMQDLQILLDRSSKLYKNRKLESASLLAKRVNELASINKDVHAIIHSNLLLGEIHSTIGTFLGDQKKQTEALNYLNVATSYKSEILKNGVGTFLDIAFGKIYQKLGEVEKSKKYFEKAVAHATNNQDLEGTVKANCALAAYYIQQVNYEKAIKAIEAAGLLLTDYKEEEKPLLYMEVYHLLTKVYFKKQQYPKIPELSKKVLKWSQAAGDVTKELTALNNIAIYNADRSDYKSAMEYLLTALDKSEEIGFRQNIAQSHINIGTIYAQLYNYNDALQRYVKVIDEFEDVLKLSDQFALNNNIGNINYTIEKYDEANQYFNSALEVAKKTNRDSMLALALTQLSRVKTAEKKYSSALQLANEAKVLLDQLGNVNGKQLNLINLANIHFHLNEYTEALKLVDEGIKISKKQKDETSEIDGYELTARIYKELEDFEKAFAFQKIFTEAKQKFTIIQRNRQVLDLDIKYAMREKQKEIAQLMKENEYQALLLEKQDQIQKQNDELKQFAYVVSHDLKEPLRMIGSFSQLIQRQYEGKKTEKTDQYFGYVQDGVHRMNHLLDALLRYSTIGGYTLKLDEVDLNETMKIVESSLKLLIQDTATKLIVEKLPTVTGSSTLLTQLFQNLISNAIKFRNPDTTPVIKISAIPNEDKMEIIVADNGIGIAQQHLEQIFVIFSRLHSREAYEGTGVGLAICQKIVQKMGGHIWVESEVGVGTEFHFTLPVG